MVDAIHELRTDLVGGLEELEEEVARATTDEHTESRRRQADLADSLRSLAGFGAKGIIAGGLSFFTLFLVSFLALWLPVVPSRDAVSIISAPVMLTIFLFVGISFLLFAISTFLLKTGVVDYLSPYYSKAREKTGLAYSEEVPE